MPLGEVLVNDPAVREHLSVAQVGAALDPAAHLGSAGALVDRALQAHCAGERHREAECERVGAALGGGYWYTCSVEARYLHALAPVIASDQFPVKFQGSAWQRAAFREPDLLPL